jgi:hypothetical protein
MNEKPQKRLVSKRQYVAVLGKTVSLYSAGMIFFCGGLILLLPLFIDAMVAWGNYPVGIRALRFASGAGVIALLLLLGKYTLIKATTIESVELLTHQNSHLLPPEETLVRASDAPPSQQQTELLRAAQYGKETPAEELLRATTRDGQDT